LASSDVISKNRGVVTKSKPGSLCPGFILEINNQHFGLPCVYDLEISNETCSLMNNRGGIYYKKPCVACVFIKNKAVDNMKVTYPGASTACFGVCFVFVYFKRPPRVLEYAVGYAWRGTNGTNYYFLLIYVSFRTTMTIE
jgi:hypothetical protein